MNEQTCGNCDHFKRDQVNTTSGTCWWATINPVPIAYMDNISLTYSTWGKDCPCWVEKVVDSLVGLGYNYIIVPSQPEIHRST